MKFPAPDKPITTCNSATCDACPVSETLQCHFTSRDLLRFLSISMPSFLFGGVGIYLANGWLLVPWLILIVAYFGFVEIRVMCSHCPHYAESDSSLRCWANYGAPKLWSYRPGPMTRVEKLVFFGGFVVIWGYPLVPLIAGLQWILLAVYILATAGFFTILKISFCSRCMNFACPLNAVGAETRGRFFDRNPGVAKAWGVDTKK